MGGRLFLLPEVYMAIQHKDITDPDIHEPKGAAVAAVGTVLFALGDGTTEWRTPDYTDLGGAVSVSSNLAEELNAYATTGQSQGVATVPQKVAFGSPVTTSRLSLNSSGVITCLTAGTYQIDISFTAGRASGGSGGHTEFFYVEMLNSAIIDAPRVIYFNSAHSASVPVFLSRTIDLAIGDTYHIEFINGSSGSDLLDIIISTTTAWGGSITTKGAQMQVYTFG